MPDLWRIKPVNALGEYSGKADNWQATGILHKRFQLLVFCARRYCENKMLAWESAIDSSVIVFWITMPAEPWFKSLVWIDYRLAVVFTIAIPLILLLWAFVQKSEAIVRLLIIYWRVASLLAITLYLMIASIPLSFVATVIARVLIPISLWFWVDINEEIDDQSPSPLKLAFTSWRWAITVYSALGALFQIPFLRCAVDKTALSSRFCQVWIDPPLLFKQYFHANTTVQFLGFLGVVGLLIYVVSLSYFVLVKLKLQGRSATGHWFIPCPWLLDHC